MSDDEAATGSDAEPATGGDGPAETADDEYTAKETTGDGGPADTAGAAWFVVGVLVVAVLSLLLVGTVFEEPFAGQATELAIGFAWLLAATYVGFRLDGSPGLRVAGALAFVLAAVAQFLSLFAASAVLSTLRLLAVVVGAAILLVVVGR